jgi:hypothetical protein
MPVQKYAIMKRSQIFCLLVIHLWPFYLVLFSSIGLAETSYLGLTPGISSRADVDKVLGQPVKMISDSLFEYTGKIYVQYRKNETVAERIEVLVPSLASRDETRNKLNLRSEPTASQITTKNRLEEYYGDSNCVILIYSSTTTASGVQRIGYFSKSFFEAAVKKMQSSEKSKAAPIPAAQSPGSSSGLQAGNSDGAYDQTTMQAWNAMLARDFSKALNLLQDAIHKDPTRGTAYNLLGQAYLYGFNDVTSAEKAMRDAIARNDKAAFRVHHDHNGSFQSFCYGWLYIGKTEISFKSDEGHGFQTTKAQIKEAKINSFMGAGYSSFHIKGPDGNYNFAPGTLKKSETNLILNLIGG